MPRAIAPDVTRTTFSPPAWSSPTCALTRSSTSVRSSRSSSATIEEPSFATTVMRASLGASGSALATLDALDLLAVLDRVIRADPGPVGARPAVHTVGVAVHGPQRVVTGTAGHPVGPA